MRNPTGGSHSRFSWPRRRIIARLAIFAVSATALGMTVGLVTASAAPKANGPTRVVKKVAGGFITTIKYADGTVARAFGGSPMHPVTSSTVTKQAIRAAAGTTATTQYSSTVVLAPDNPTTTLAAKLRQGGYTGPSAYQALLLLGDTPAQAAPFLDFDQAPTCTGCTTTVTASGATAATKTGVATTATTPVSPSQIRDQQCVDWYSDGNHVHSSGCDTQYLVWKNPNVPGDWYFLDKHKESSTINDSGCVLSCDHLTGLKFQLDYPSGNTIYDWDPDAMTPEGSCVTTTAGAEAKGFSVSTSATSCPEQWGLVFKDINTFATKWDGQGSGPSNSSRATHGDAATHNPPSAAATISVSGQVWWTTCC